MNYLLDVNLLVALLWPSHSLNAVATEWRAGKALAICPITELGFLRVSCSPALGASMEQARKALADFLEADQPQFVAADVWALDGLPATRGNQTTDFYLGNLAAAHGMKLATLDTGLKHPAAEVISSKDPAGQTPAG